MLPVERNGCKCPPRDERSPAPFSAASHSGSPLKPPDAIAAEDSPYASLISESAACAERPTLVRYGVLALSVSMAVILYLDRMAISVAMPDIARDLNTKLPKVADAVATFFWCYALFQIPAGWLGDRWGARRTLTLYVVAWSLAMGGLGLVGGLATLILMRALLGIGQAGAYATTAGLLRRWIPFTTRGFANSAVSLGGRAGGVLAPLVTAWLIALVGFLAWQVFHWRPVFIGYGLVGIVWAAFFWRWFRDTPREHPRCNAAEVALIEGPLHEQELVVAASAAVAPRISVSTVAGARSIQLLCFINYVINVGWILVGTLLPTFLISMHGYSRTDAGLATSLVATAGMAGCLCGGVATDYFVRRVGLTWGRRIPCVFSYGGAAISYGCCFFLSDPEAIVVLLIISSFLGDFGLGPLWGTYQDIGGNYSGTVLGVGNMFGNVGAAMATSFVPRLAEQYGWSASFALSAGMYGMAAIAWLFVNPRLSLAMRAALAKSRPDVVPSG